MTLLVSRKGLFLETEDIVSLSQCTTEGACSDQAGGVKGCEPIVCLPIEHGSAREGMGTGQQGHVQTLYRYLEHTFIGGYQHHGDGMVSPQEGSKLLTERKNLDLAEITLSTIYLKLSDKHLSAAVEKGLACPEKISLYKLPLKKPNQISGGVAGKEDRSLKNCRPH